MKATIIIPNINGKGWLKDSIESVYAQTEQDFELIVVDNGSTDESLDVYKRQAWRWTTTTSTLSARRWAWCSSTSTSSPT